MAPADTYKTIKSASNGLYKEKGSKFISAAYPVREEQEIRKIIDDTKKEHHEARHHCYAYMTGRDGLTWRANDDGEPSGTAGRPILGQIKSFGVTNVLVIVSRYFGGTLLGVSGLINAYKSAAGSALSNAEMTDHIIHDTYEIYFPYQAMKDVMKILKDEEIGQTDHKFDLECRIVISIRSSVTDLILKRLARIEGITYNFLSVE
jgi:uncharacterized YigZ family protein